MSRFVWGTSIVLVAFGFVGTALMVDGVAVDSETGTMSGDELAYFAWAVASVGGAAAVMNLLGSSRPLWMGQPSRSLERLRGAPLVLSFATLFMLFGIGSMAINASLSKQLMGDSWVPIGIGIALTVAGLVMSSKSILWEIDESVSTRRGEDHRVNVGLSTAILGAGIIAVSFATGLAITSDLYGTGDWEGGLFTTYILVGHAVGLLVMVAGFAMASGTTPFPHWRVNYRPPGAD